MLAAMTDILDQYADLLANAFDTARAVHEIGPKDPTERFAEFRGKPNLFAKEILGETLWAAQRCINDELIRTQRVTVRSCRSSGKTRDIATLVLYFMNCFQCKVITVGASWENVRDQMWAEINALHAASRRPLLGKPLTTEYRLGPKHFAKGFAAKKEERSQGYHAGRIVPEDPDAPMTDEELDELYAHAVSGDGGEMIVWIIDEAVGVEQRVIAPIIGSLAPNAYLIMFANPSIDPAADHSFPRSHEDDSGYSRIKIAAEPADDPITSDHAFIGVPGWLLAPRTIEEWKHEWGESSPMWWSHGLALFHGDGIDCQLISLSLLEAANARTPEARQGPWIGVDLARTRDECVAALWFNGVRVAEKVWRPRSADQQKLMTVAQTIISLSHQWGKQLEGIDEWTGSIPANRINVDKTGMGEGVTDRLAQQGYSVNRIDFGSKPKKDWPELNGEMIFANRRAELHWSYRRVLEEGLARLPKRWKQAWQQAQWPRFETSQQGHQTVLKIEPKDRIQVRHGRSPDALDADILAWARPNRTRPHFRKVRL